MTDRHCDLMKQGFMRGIKPKKQKKQLSDEEWKASLGEAAKGRYGPGYFDDGDANSSEEPQAMTDIANLIERLNIMSGMLRMGERIAFGSDADALEEAATALQELQKEISNDQEFRLTIDREWKAKLDHVKAKRDELQKEVERLNLIHSRSKSAWFDGNPPSASGHGDTIEDLLRKLLEREP